MNASSESGECAMEISRMPVWVCSNCGVLLTLTVSFQYAGRDVEPGINED
jgi:hypothetical protein